MQNVLSLERFKTVDPRKLAALGCDVQQGKILCAAPDRIKNFTDSSCPALFRCLHNNEGKVTLREYIPVTKAEASKLQHALDPITEQPYLKFAYIPLPKIAEKTSFDDIDEVSFGGPRTVDSFAADLQPAKKQEASVPMFADEASDTKEETKEAAALETQPEVAEFAKAESEKGDENPATKVERKELEAKTVAELKKILKEDLGLEIPKSATKSELIELILG